MKKVIRVRSIIPIAIGKSNGVNPDMTYLTYLTHLTGMTYLTYQYLPSKLSVEKTF